MKVWLPSVLLLIWLAFSALFSVSLNEEIYFYAQQRSGVNAENCGLDDAERMAFNQNVCKYLAGREDQIEGLSETARSHMTDVKRLFDLSRWILKISFALAVVTFVILPAREKARFPRALCVSGAVFIGAMAAVGAFAAFRFDSLFTAFHRLVFSNDNWLLDPAEDVLIRVMPAEFFQRMALYTGIAACLFTVIAWAASLAVRSILRRMKEL